MKDGVGFLQRIEERLALLNISARAASEKTGHDGDLIRNMRRSIMSGKGYSPKISTLDALAKALDTTPEWLIGPANLEDAIDITGEKSKVLVFPVSKNGKMNVYSSAEGGDGSLIISTDIVERIPRPYTLEDVDTAYGVLIEGESMFPAFEPGDIAWVNPFLGARKGHDAIFYEMRDELGESKALIKRIVSFTDVEWTLLQHNPQKTFKLDRGLWRICHRVVGKMARR